MSNYFENCLGRLNEDENRNKITSIIAGSFVSVNYYLVFVFKF